MAGLLEAFQGRSPRIEAIRRQVTRLLARQEGARRLPPILILGETGTGKGLLARSIHGPGRVATGRSSTINCAAIPETLLEAELFGYERGAFTDARHAKPGLVQAAHGGTLFLDEIGLLPAALQSKLLTVIEDRAVRRLGSTRAERRRRGRAWPRRASISGAPSPRVASARISTIGSRSSRSSCRRCACAGPDILALADHFLARACADYGLSPRTLTPEARAALAAYRWPGNVRELANAMERVALLSDGDEITEVMLDFLVPDGIDGAGRRDGRRPIPGRRRAHPHRGRPARQRRQHPPDRRRPRDLAQHLARPHGQVRPSAARPGRCRREPRPSPRRCRRPGPRRSGTTDGWPFCA